MEDKTAPAENHNLYPSVVKGSRLAFEERTYILKLSSGAHAKQRVKLSDYQAVATASHLLRPVTAFALQNERARSVGSSWRRADCQAVLGRRTRRG
eukprot:1997571-Pleurochrysis_carterae.AAC.1